ncbi:MAG: Bifunctional oligoribonuclease and PAP phosphatase NrnA [Syntrophorhabdaceae bacterium PtaU1.Bin034]|nr:MAG: Bifunctional oligoribonuclease and PAP phosphatase NrnA [Syntrophorhabdaceae bacterium PtaU1.Bin034]
MFQRIRDVLDRGRNFLITTHIDPDGDALGSSFALAFALNTLGKRASVYLKDEVPYRYRFLPRPPVVLHQLPEERYDAIFVVDCGDLFRVGDGYDSLKNKGMLINIDHHDTSEAFGQINIVDERASSTAEIIYLILKSLGGEFTPDIAVNLYTAILTDTGSFRYDSTTKRAFSICEEMTEHGVSPSYVAGAVYESHPKERFQLLCLVLSTLETFRDDKIATAYITQEMFARTHTNREYTEGFVEFLKEMRGVEVACIMRELSDKKYKISLRSKGSVDVAAVARSFGGGGHRKAAGCVIEGDLNEVKNKLIGAFSL